MSGELPLGSSRTPVADDRTAAFGKEIGPSAVCMVVNIKLMAAMRPSYWPPSAPARKRDVVADLERPRDEQHDARERVT